MKNNTNLFLSPLFWMAALVFCGQLYASTEVQIDATQSRLKAVAKATGHSFEAVATQFDCKLVVDETSGTPESAKISFNVHDLKTGKDKRDTEMLHWMDSESFGVITFEFKGWKGEAKKTALGELSMHGVGIDVEVPVEYSLMDGAYTVSGKFEIDTTDFGLKIIKKMLFLTVEPAVAIEFELKGKL